MLKFLTVIALARPVEVLLKRRGIAPETAGRSFTAS